MNDTHRVRRWRWQARAPAAGEAFALRLLLREQHDACQAALARGLDGLVPAGEVWHLPRLALTVRVEDLADIDAGRLAERIEVAARAALAGAALVWPVPDLPGPAASGARTGAAGSDLRAPSHRTRAADERLALLHYLHTGLLPWTLAGVAIETARRVLVNAAVLAVEDVMHGSQALEDLLPTGPDGARIGALLRWLPLLPAALRRRWFAAHPGGPALPSDVVGNWRAWLDTDAMGSLDWQALWLAMPLAPAALRERMVALRVAGAVEPPFVTALARALDTGPETAGHAAVDPASIMPTAPVTAPLPGASRHGPEAAVPAALLVPLAGLVLLHPWLPRLLAACGVLDAGAKAIPPALLPRACTLLHALACGDCEAAEHELPFVKLLLGRRPDEPLGASLPSPSADDRAEIDALLASVREHWAALRGTGVDGLRLSFLQRRGLLSSHDGVWQLRLQGESFDLLLATLPWAIGLVRLPWMQSPLTVEWHAP